jgi:hypothetical protein
MNFLRRNGLQHFYEATRIRHHWMDEVAAELRDEIIRELKERDAAAK